MTLKRYVVLASMLAAVTSAHAQSGEKYSARLGWVPTAGAADRANVTGRGAATAALTGNTLAIAGTFEGLAAPATIARLHRGVAIGARGPVIADLTVTKAASGTITGSVDLTAENLADLKRGRLYVQVHSEKGVAQDNSNLWGWLMRAGN
jgi:hypothetical protein